MRFVFRHLISILPLLLTLCLLTACSGYKVKGDKVYRYGWNEGRGFYEDLLEGADPKTFAAVRQYEYAGRAWNSSPHWDYGKDATHVYWCDSLIAGADAATFSVVASDSDDGGWVVFDKNRIYHGRNCKAVERYKREVLKLRK